MRKILFILLCLISVSIKAQDLKNFYVQATHDEGILFFVYPQKMDFVTQESLVRSKKLLYDYTYLTSKDNVTLLTTLLLDDILDIESMIITTTDGESVSCKLEKIFVQPKSKRWKYRFRAEFKLDFMKRMYDSTNPFTIKFISKDNRELLTYRSSKSAWNKVRPKFNKFLFLVGINKQ